MSRDEGFAIADISTSTLDDAKVKALWRTLRSEAEMNAALVLYEATQLTSWRQGERVTAEDSAPGWMSDVASPTKGLVDVGLLDATHRIPRRSWNTWFGTAFKRREETRERWRRAKAKREQHSDPSGNVNGGAAETPRGGNGGSTGPSVRPSVPTESLSESGQQQPGARATRRGGQRPRGNGRPEAVSDVLPRIPLPDLPAFEEKRTPELEVGMAIAEPQGGRR